MSKNVLLSHKKTQTNQLKQEGKRLAKTEISYFPVLKPIHIGEAAPAFSFDPLAEGVSKKFSFSLFQKNLSLLQIRKSRMEKRQAKTKIFNFPILKSILAAKPFKDFVLIYSPKAFQKKCSFSPKKNSFILIKESMKVKELAKIKIFYFSNLELVFG